MGLELVLALGVALVGAVGAVAWAVARNRDRRNQVVPGVPTPAPAAWAGSHTPEARLHRRLRAAVEVAQRAARRPSSSLWSGRQAVEEAALAVDERLVVVAGVPERERGPMLADVTAQVAAVEHAAAGLAGAILEERDRLDAVDAALDRVELLRQARAEVEQAARPWELPTDAAPSQDTQPEGGAEGRATSG